MASMQFLSSPTALGDSSSPVITVGDSSSSVVRTVSPIPAWDCPECYMPKVSIECARCHISYHPSYNINPTNGTNIGDSKKSTQHNGTSLHVRGCWRCHMSDNDAAWQWWRPCNHCNALKPLCSSSIPILSLSLPTFKCRYCQHDNNTQELWCCCETCIENNDNKFIDSSCPRCELLSLPSSPSSSKKRSRSEQSEQSDIDIKKIRTVV